MRHHGTYSAANVGSAGVTEDAPSRSAWGIALAGRLLTVALLWWVVFHVDATWLRVLIAIIALLWTGIAAVLVWAAWRSRTGSQ